MNKLGVINLQLINDDTASFYRFFYRHNDDNDDIYVVSLDNVVMKYVNLHMFEFTAYSGLIDYLNSITNDTTNISYSDKIFIVNEIHKFLSSGKSCLEIILPVADDKNYTQNDIDEIYNTAIQTLGI